jgi:hypothetical protein
VIIGCDALRLKWNRVSEYLIGPLTSFNSGWHSEWFYLKNNPECSLLAYTDGYYDMTQEAWSDGPPKKDHRRLLFKCLGALKVL